MKINLKSHIKSIDGSSNNDVVLELKSYDGSVETKLVTAKEAMFVGTLTLKRVIGQEVKLGSVVKIEITIDDPKENS